MKLFNYFLMLLLFGLFIIGCSSEDTTTPATLNHIEEQDELLGESVTLSNYSYGSEPSSGNYTAVHYKGIIRKGLENITQLFPLSQSADHYKWIVFYGNKKGYTDKYSLSKKEIEGVGVCYLKGKKYIYDILQSEKSGYKLLKSVEMGNSFPVRLLDEFIPTFRNPENVKSVIFIANENQGNILNYTPKGAFQTIKRKLLNFDYQYGEVGLRSCDCNALPCCREEGCAWDSPDYSFCGWDDYNNWICKSCATFSCIKSRGIEEGAICLEGTVYNDSDQFKEKAYLIRDSLLNKTNLGREYIDKYYKIGSLVDIEELLNLFSCAENAMFSIETLLAAERLNSGNSNDIVITESYYELVSQFITRYKHHYASNVQFSMFLDEIMSDIDNFKGKSKSYIVSNIN